MTQKSIFWTTNGTGDGDHYTQTEWFQFVARMFQTDVTVQGVIAGFENELEVAVDSTDLLIVTGGAVVAGIPYQNDGDVRLTPTVPVIGTTGGFVGLRADYTAQTVRLVLRQSADGVASEPAVVQNTSTYWDIRLASYTITTGGVITITTDRREFLEYPSSTVYRRIGGNISDWSLTGSTLYKVGFPRVQCGSVRWTGAAAVNGTLTVPLSVTGFVNKGIPIAIAQQANKVVSCGMTAADELEITWYERDGVSTSTTVDFYFIIIGPGNV